ncbi:protein MODIFYING WALL LIGNIN-1 [Heracleum sosnowskyi]|uniref:Protein MODIFYING WALL LIGNIN-1 n=1 Tax=Heracleum sosnowskyi TaxID=360622 RepID=A0AAD8NBH6_9APIA|nr:protein MODIFYING WALL LIGNIN-1 [Heracleum sosnowskyi]
MERNRLDIALILTFVILIALLSFALCIAAEFKKSKKKDIRLDGRLCYIPKSDAYGLGISALVCLFAAQILTNFFICKKFWFGRDRNSSSTISSSSSSCKPRFSGISILLLSVSWISFVISAILVSAATSMSQSQPFGDGWLDGECYIVKDGVYIGSGILALFAVGEGHPGGGDMRKQ